MSRLLADTPFVEVLLRKEFCFDGGSGHGGFYPGYIHAFSARPASVPAFDVMLHCGARWSAVPIHMLATRECEPIDPGIACWWDCFSNNFEVVELALLKGLRCQMRGRDGTVREGNYLFTIDWRGLWADLPDQHKNHHVIAGKDGHIFAYPNNKIRWIDQSYVVDMPEESKSWRPNSRRWSVEG